MAADASVDLLLPAAGPQVARLRGPSRSVAGQLRQQRSAPRVILRQAGPWHDRPRADFGLTMFALAHADPVSALHSRRRRGYGRPFAQYPPVAGRIRRPGGRNLVPPRLD